MQQHALLSRIVLFLFFCFSIVAQECSETVLCATGCCSQYGFCGTDDAHCGDGCLSTCDFKLACDAKTLCASGCCSKVGFCGLGPDYDDDDENGEKCVDLKLSSDLSKAEVKVVSEHTIEIQSIPRYLLFVLSGVLDGSGSTGLSKYTSNYKPTKDVVDFLKNGDATWISNYKQDSMTMIMTNLGSIDIPGVLANCEVSINGVKAKLWSLKTPISTTALKNAGADQFTEAGYKAFIAKYKSLLGVWKYLSEAGIESKMRLVYTIPTIGLGDHNLWEMSQEYLVFHTGRMAEFTRNHVEPVFSDFIARWESWLAARGPNVTPGDIENARNAIKAAKDLLNEFANVNVPDEIFQSSPQKRSLLQREERPANLSKDDGNAEGRHAPQRMVGRLDEDMSLQIA
ncbi:hypothetical protein BX600DRAFT_439604 [Xylariales sp. PMI_506]|nr:hypothetical protein BX600DRAFT_439604 [Xylariales sp. PMI_506]